MNDKTDRLLEAIEHPERFSDEELNALLSEPEIRELYDLMSKTSDAVAETPIYDLDKEWDTFVTNHYRSKNFILKFFNRHAAAVVALGIVASLAVVAATVGIKYAARHNEPNPKEAIALESPAIIKEKVITNDSTPSTDSRIVEVVTFKDESFETLVNIISDYYGATYDFKKPNVKDLHLYYKWDQSLPLTEVVNELNNFEQINIVLSDNVLTIE